MNQVKYEIIEKGETSSETMIRKTGGVVEFKYGDIQAAIEYGNKKKIEIEAQIKIAEATKQNIERTHPQVIEMSAEDLTAAYLYRQAIGVVNGGLDKVKELDFAMEEDKQALKDIFEQTGISQITVEPGQSN